MNTLMKKCLLHGFILLSIVCTMTAKAQPVSVDVKSGAGGQPVAGDASEQILEYLKNFGLYFGFDITQKPKEPIKTGLLDSDNKNANRTDLSNLVNSYLGAIPVSVSNKKSGNEDIFIPSVSSFAQSINSQANLTMTKYQSPQDYEFSVNPKLDQTEYQDDPVSQALLNILTIPYNSSCTDEVGNVRTKDENCPTLYKNTVVNNVIGDIPIRFYDYEWNKTVLNQLNSNSLTAPLMYSLTQKPDAIRSRKSGGSGGLSAPNQAVQAANFIKYAISDVLPLQLISWQEYARLYNQYLETKGNNATADDKQAKIILENYLASLRVYAAQRSVAISNLYDIMSRRMLQAPRSDDGNAQPTSEALSEFTMAAWRLKNIGDGKAEGPSEKWIQKINNASSDTVQKEIALLLAEMNYQLYLSRQQQERILLTNTMILIENMKGNAPSLREIKENFAINQPSGQSQLQR